MYVISNVSICPQNVPTKSLRMLFLLDTLSVMYSLYIVSRHLATRGNNKILHTPPPHIISYEEILPSLTRHTLAQFRTNKLPYLKSYLHKVDAKWHPSPLFPLCDTNTHHLFNFTHIRTTLSPMDLWTDPAGVTADGRGEAGWWTTSRNIGLHPLARVMGVGRQQQHVNDSCLISLDTSTVSRQQVCLPWFDVVSCLLK